MKKQFVIAIIIFGLTVLHTESKAQANWEVGARFGDRGSIEATIPLGIAPRIKPAVFFYNEFGAAAYFDWMFKLNEGPSGLKFFPGIGPEFFFENDFDFAAAADLGVEYAFEFPLTIGFDWRPAIFFTNSRGFEAGHWGFSARFRFGDKVKFEKDN